MQLHIPNVGRSASVKAVTIGVLILVLLIPMAMIKGVVHDRQSVHEHARAEIKRSWGMEQLVAGPILVIPYRETIELPDREPLSKGHQAYLLPEDLRIEVDTQTEIRYRGIHEVPVYTATIRLTGSFAAPDARWLGLDPAWARFEDARVSLSVSDSRAISEIPRIEIGDYRARFVAGGPRILSRTAAISAEVGEVLGTDGRAFDFSIELKIKGSESLNFLPLAETTHARMTSSWSNPSFVGQYLPESHTISPDGFGAEWSISSLGRNLPSEWRGPAEVECCIEKSAFGVTFYMPVSLYQTTLRTTKYAVLFIGLSFVAYFLFEILAKLRLHPLQYLLVGFANALFYLLLLSLAEHLGFALAYWLSAAASVALIAGYSGAVLGGRRRGLTMAGVLALLYAFLYMTLKAENFALLAGAIGLWVALATIMWVTRHIDWYGYAQADAGAESS